MANTRKQKALELKRLLMDGPSMGWTFCHDLPNEKARKDAEKFARESFQRWSHTWCVPLVEALLANELKP